MAATTQGASWVLLAMLVLMPSTGNAQVLGVFRWQFQPFCNVVTFTVEQRGGSYLLTGSDDACGGGAAPSPALGVAAPNPDGTIGIGFSIVTSSASVAQVKATLSPATISGSWRDGDGNTGTFAFNPGGVGGSPRPGPRTQITAGQISAGAVGTEALAASIYAGTGGAATVARSDHLHDDRYLLRGAAGPRGLIGQVQVSATGTLQVQRLSNGLVATVTKGGAGVYFVAFPGFGTNAQFDQMVSITPDFVTPGSGWRSCAVNLRAAGGANSTFTVTVQCYNSAFAAADAAFFIIVTA